ncbi:DNA repair protein XRCC3 homolog [Striga hermonthica]|uniref:DNA repair protein XRCC3 homolog n=1 Tax=Striga hermonthica TaxID=68872 RepID=A0A9N7R3I4_STRHE|nr:DNA repair protein XRCC3 homolog [Striga hermonthica]
MKPEELLRNPLPAPPPKLTVGCPLLDRLLGGGVPCESITEIVAESGTGKTQLSLQLLLAAQLPPSRGGLDASALYLHSEFPFPSRRLHQLSSHTPHLPRDPLARVYVESLTSADHLLDVLPRLDLWIPKLNIKLLVIDSIAALFRGEYDNTPLELKRRSGVFFKVSSKLRLLARKFELAVVVTNQVVDVIGGSAGLRVGNVGSQCSSGRRVCAALGLSWANCVNIRLFMWREEVGGGEDGSFQSLQTRRFVRVDFAPHLPDSSCEFVIRKEGVFGVP